MKKIFLFLIISIVATLAIVSAGLFNVGSAITRNVAFGKPIAETNNILCTDKDGGVYPEVPNYVLGRKKETSSAKTLRDLCSGKSERITTSDGKKIKVWPKIKEGYCDPATGIVSVIELDKTSVDKDSVVLGDGYCVYTKITGYNRKIAKWVSTLGSPTCNELADGKVYANDIVNTPSCSDSVTFVSYSCDDTTGEFVTGTENCTLSYGEYGKCTPNGCVGSCIDTDEANNKNFGGKVTADGEEKKDTCNADNTHIQQ